jgi:L,D-transpeptidase catalytic domain
MTRAALVAALVAGAALAGGAPPASAGAVRLSDEFATTRWAYANDQVQARARPRFGAKGVARLRYSTEDGLPEIYLVLARRRIGFHDWIKVRLPMRPNGRTGWVRREALGPYHLVRTSLRINRTTLRATLYRRGRRVWSSRVGIGRSGMETPKGHFYIRERLTGFGATYGPVAFGTSAYSRLSDWPGGGVIGIHGTDQPSLIPGRPSHGCIRLPNRAVLRLARLMPLGTPVRVVGG